MVVKNMPYPLDKIRKIMRAQNDVLLTSDLAEHGIPRTYLSILEQNGEVQRISRGVYTSKNSLPDEMVILQAQYKGAIFSHETALYVHELTDRTPLFYSVSVPSGYNATSLKAAEAKVFFVQRELYALGLVIKESPHGNEIKTFDLERTICDLLRSRNRIDDQIVNEALKRYVIHPARNIALLYRYATQFRIQKITRATIEILL